MNSKNKQLCFWPHNNTEEITHNIWTAAVAEIREQDLDKVVIVLWFSLSILGS